MATDLIPIQNLIYEIRGQNVMLDRDLAMLYGVEVRVLNQAVKRNMERFPTDFMFQLTQDEWDILRSQIVTANKNISKVRFIPFVFTEHGVLMLSNVLNSSKAISVSIEIIRIFDRLRQYTLAQSTTDSRIEDLRKILLLHIESNDNKFAEQDETINQIIRVLNNLKRKQDKSDLYNTRTNFNKKPQKISISEHKKTPPIIIF